MTETMKVSEAREKLSVARCTIYEMIRDGRVPSIRLGRTIRVPRAEFERLLEGTGAKAGVIG